MSDVGPHAGDRATDEAPNEPVDAEELRQGLTGLRDALADARTELADARRHLEAAAAREARSREAGEVARLPLRIQVRARASRLLHRLRRATGRVIVRLSPGAVLPFVWHNPLFDASWYREHNPDVRDQGLAPERHYRRHGAIEGRDPNAFFDTSWYLARYPDVAASRINPLDHYLLYGAGDFRIRALGSTPAGTWAAIRMSACSAWIPCSTTSDTVSPKVATPSRVAVPIAQSPDRGRPGQERGWDPRRHHRHPAPDRSCQLASQDIGR